MKNLYNKIIKSKKEYDLKINNIKKTALKYSLTYQEYKRIQKKLKRKPNDLELYLFQAMWSEHCSYKHSKKYLAKLPKNKALYSNENSGGIEIDNKIIFFKVESHNHPSAVEPFQGAATGVGGIIRDILTLNARPVALFNSLKFNHIKDSKTKYLFENVVKGISFYGNSIGVPTIGGELSFNSCYNNSPIVNVLALGIADKNKVKLASKAKEGLHIVLIGSPTGRDGLNGAAFASCELDINNLEKQKPQVQIADPFLKKLLIESMLEILDSDEIIASQDCGAAGILSSTSEIAYLSNCGVELYLDKVHTSYNNILPFEIMLSESQERMVVISTDLGLKHIDTILSKYNLPYSIIGKTVKEKVYRLFFNNKLIADVTPKLLNEPIFYSLKSNRPAYIKQIQSKTLKPEIKIQKQENYFINLLKHHCKEIISDPTFASKKWIYEQYDYMVRTSTIIPPGLADTSSIIIDSLDNNSKIIALNMNSNEKKSYIDPYLGAKNIIYESYQNLISSGFNPVAITDCLNFANPEKNDIAYQFKQTINGIKDSVKELNLSIVSGNVSFYNENINNQIYPTVTIGNLGVINSYKDLISNRLKAGNFLYLIGKEIDDKSKIGGSLFQDILYNFIGGKLDLPDKNLTFKLKNIIFHLRNKNLLTFVKTIGKGGILGSILKACFLSNLGFKGDLIKYNPNDIKTLDQLLKVENLLFGEINNRYIIGVNNKKDIERILKYFNIPYRYLGTFCENRFIFNNVELDLTKLNYLYYNTISLKMEKNQ